MKPMVTYNFGGVKHVIFFITCLRMSPKIGILQLRNSIVLGLRKDVFQEMDQQITLYGTSWCGDCRRAIRVLDQLQASYKYVNIDQDEAAAAYVVQVNNGSRSVPTIVFPDGSVLVEPSNTVLTKKLVDSKLVAAN